MKWSFAWVLAVLMFPLAFAIAGLFRFMDGSLNGLRGSFDIFEGPVDKTCRWANKFWKVY